MQSYEDFVSDRAEEAFELHDPLADDDQFHVDDYYSQDADEEGDDVEYAPDNVSLYPNGPH